ncbi:hypothetical protein PIROE2DRAFT_57797 [Piromyces sp. E2]|nr:hypothetical protein PIROE2DRAFT_57797 [Piromyces sp. E2]|eukprot:OUM68820.1 hypothetical protein PIROE2DRAFT_57797 [Piromyces sp. E2]
MMKSSSLTSVTSTTTTSSLINSALTTSQIISNVENENFVIKRDSNDIKSANQIKYDESFNITNNISKATQYRSPKHSTRSNSTHSLDEYYSSSPIPTPKARSIVKSNTIPLPSYSFNTSINSNSTLDQIDEYVNEYGYIYSEEELDTYKNVSNFICKIAQLILRSRVGLSYNHNFNVQLNKKNKNRENHPDRNNNSSNSYTNSFANMTLRDNYASSISSNESQNQSISYSINSSYTSSFDNSYSSNNIFNTVKPCNGCNDFYIPTPSIDNIKQLHSLLMDRMPFWKNRIPINIDIFANASNKRGNESFRKRSNEYSQGNDLEKDNDSNYYEHKTNNNSSSSTTRVRSSSISNIYPINNLKTTNTTSNKFNNKRLLERWVVSYEPTNEHEPLNKGRNSKVDTTDFILLVQSLYSYIRLMPIHSLLSDNSIKKSDLQYCISTADGFLLLPLLEDQNNDIEFCDIGSSGFDLSAKLKVYKFTKASTHLGNLHISVVYDANVNNKNPSNLSHSHSKPISTSSSSVLYNDSNRNSQSSNNIGKVIYNHDSKISELDYKNNDSTKMTSFSEHETSKTSEDKKFLD